MNEQPTPPSVPSPPPKLNATLLWLTILGPIGLIGIFTIMAFSEIEFDFMNIAPSLTVLAILIGWIVFGVVLSKRFRGAGLVLCLIGYPLAQAAICFAIFFFGCLASLGGNWGHRAPDSWVEEQERLARENAIDPEKLKEAEEALERHLDMQENPPTTEAIPPATEKKDESEQ
ncbi:hypothetical protein [Roseibacillus persicicus]|uniref:hypothetical protein n=1 Tax=Roseibacillus persicicus TaxID=454148 RepID=UPI00280D01AC|nr:hypothetical protein [Roseibacillus persicicus]MDQ8191372.1 hypothetical protein [Roseibacillus persicicus]